ncbi:hypothetical protein [Rhodohalobacter halophilus]|uniref:hypothetical protein n=1 Tax=Rhodohalobacter halophilus TaxID=1812810 RepID=UPI00083FA2E4|nr:hypothetical protein [Rhodohalobacter halophilus]
MEIQRPTPHFSRSWASVTCRDGGGAGLTAGLYSFDSGFSADQYRTGYEQFTVTEASENQWEAFYLNAGPRFEQSLSRFVSMNLGLDLAMNYQEAPSQTVRFYDSTGEMESSGVDSDLVLAEMDAGDNAGGWSAAIRPQMQFDFKPGFSDRFSFNIKTGIQHHLSDREITYSERDLSRVMQVDNAFEMYSQFENAPVVQHTESAPKTNFFANAGIKISFGGSRAPAAPGQDYNSSRSNKPGGSIANDGIGDGDPDSDDDGIDDAVETAQDYNSSRSNKPTSEAAPDDVIEIKRDGLAVAENYIDDIIDVLDRCEEEVCTQVRLNADGRKDKSHQVKQSQISQDQGIEDIHSIVMEDVVSLSKCESAVCGEVLAMEQALLGHMNALMGVVQATRAQDYNAARSNKPTSRAADIGDGDADSDNDGIDDAIETAKDYNSSRSNKPRSEARDDLNDDDCDDEGPCPRPDDVLANAKELGLASAGNDISSIMQVLDRCEEGVCGQVRQHADERHHGVVQARENPSDIDMHIEEILNIVKEDVESLGSCETDVCREVLAMEESLLVKMNRLSELAQIAPARDYNSSRSNKPSTRAADIGDGDMDSDDDGIDDGLETAQDYNSSRSNKPSTRAADIGDGDMDSDDDGIDDGLDFTMARLANPSGLIVKTGMVAAGGNPLYSGNTNSGENPLNEGQANDGDSDGPGSSNVQQYTIQPGSYCMEIGTNSQPEMNSSAQADRGIDKKDIRRGKVDSDGFPDFMKTASFSISKRSARTGRNPSGDEDMDSDGDGIQFNLEIDPIDEDSDDDGVLDAIETASYSISKRSARTGRSAAAGGKEIETMEWNEGTARQMASDDDPCGPGVWARTTGGSENCIPENSEQENPLAQESGRQETPVLENIPPGNVYRWTYNLTSLTDAQEIPGRTLTVLFTGGTWHFNVHIDPDDDGDGYGDLLQNSSFSISKRSARTGRN